MFHTTYDALGRRIQRSANSGITNFVYDGPDVVRDLNANLSTASDYLNGADIDNKLRQTVSGTSSYFTTDHLGTTRAVTDASGTVTSSLNYDSFGAVVSGSPLTRYTYTGRESDPDTGLVYYRARWYASQLGRFISEDPIGFRGHDLDLYAYVKNDPNRFKDPSGRDIYGITGSGSASIGLGNGGAVSANYLIGLNFTSCGLSLGGAGGGEDSSALQVVWDIRTTKALQWEEVPEREEVSCIQMPPVLATYKGRLTRLSTTSLSSR